MRVMHVVATGTRRGAETFARDLAAALDPAGVDQRVVVLHGDRGLDVGFTVPVDAIEASGPRLPVLRVDRGRLRELRPLVDRFRPDVLQLHGGETLKYAALLRKRSPLVYRRIGSTAGRRMSPLRKWIHALLMRRTAAVVAVADAVRAETLREFHLDERRVVTIPNAVDPERLRPRRTREDVRRELGIEPSARVVLSLGALTWEKDPLTQLRAGAAVARRDRRTVHVFAGDGPLRADLERAAAVSGAGERVRIVGSRADVPDLLEACDVLLMASATEGMPAVAIEAGMAGVPVVAFAAQGIPEVVVHEATGLLAPPGDVGELTACLLRVVADEAATDMGANARRRCLALFDIRPVARAYLDLYRKVVA